jgi:hypothetical protein
MEIDMDDSKGREQRPHETIVIRQNELVQKHPNLKPMLMEDPLARAWMESWSRTEMSIEDGLAELAVHLQKAKQGTFERLEDCIARNPGHSLRAV